MHHYLGVSNEPTPIYYGLRETYTTSSILDRNETGNTKGTPNISIFVRILCRHETFFHDDKAGEPRAQS